MRTRHTRTRRRGLLTVVAALTVATVAAPTNALNFIYLCLCCRPDGSVRYLAGWCNATCDWILSNISAAVGCDTLFTALIVPGSGGVGDGFAPAFDRAAKLGGSFAHGAGAPEISIVMGYYPTADSFVPVNGSYSTRVFAIRTLDGVRAVNQYAPIDIAVNALDPSGVCTVATSFAGGEPITDPFTGMPMGLVATGDASIVVYTVDHATNPTQAIEARVIPVDFASLPWQDALVLPPMCIGDCNRSGAVNFADVTTTLGNFGHTYEIGVMMPGDANGDRVVNFGDVTAILATFGSACGGTP